MNEIERGSDEDSPSWQLTDADRGRLEVLRDAVRAFAATARSANDLMAVGEAWQALGAILDGEPVEVNVELSFGFRCGDDVSEGGLYVSLRVNDEEVRLSRMNTTWDIQLGSDRFTQDCAILTPEGAFYPCDGARWLQEYAAIRSRDDATLSTSREHV
jgi:hypothetical protein